MTALLGLALALTLQTAPPAQVWAWTLYADNGPLVLANEIPDTPRLRTTLECAPGSSIVRLTLYDAAPAEGIAVVTSGAASSNAEVRPRRGQLQTMLRADHPVFAAFQANGRLQVTVGQQSSAIEIDRANLSKLRRFAELCTG
ncbi:hypothetical protein U0030_02290 [Brevundimonas bullata]|uniref:hypothetical protein n=1 Tax=Brevundimonas bullata TaxID=13160 RepID=UPI000E0A74BC|nr:hypothetical protein [Brevundimonas bullata]WQE37329.1 hypothetical protein U0030_02290 [Brevundimonas bullata]